MSEKKIIFYFVRVMKVRLRKKRDQMIAHYATFMRIIMKKKNEL